MKTSVLLTRWCARDEINLIQFGFKLMLIALFLINYTVGFAQQKVVNQQEMQQKLTEVNGKIQEIDLAIVTINTRIAGILPENLAPSVQVQLNDLQILKDQYTREKISIEAKLNTSQDFRFPSQADEISKPTFFLLPNQNQDKSLT